MGECEGYPYLYQSGSRQERERHTQMRVNFYKGLFQEAQQWIIEYSGG